MTAPLRLELFGVPAQVSFERGVDDAGAAALARAWSRCAAATVPAPHPSPSAATSPDGTAGTAGPAVQASLAVGRAQPFTVGADTFAEFACLLTSYLTVAAIEERAGELMMLHASGLADPETGRTVAFVARSGMGKTTATRILGPRLGYVSDETVALDRAGRILPYPKPLSVIEDPPPAPKAQRGPDTLGLGPTPASATLAGVVLLERRPGLEAAVLEPVGHGDALVELAPQTSALASIARPLAWLCGVLDAVGGALRARYSEAEQLAVLVPGILARAPLTPAWRDAHDGGPRASARPGTPSGGGLAAGWVRRADVVDAVEVDGPEGPEVLVLVGTTLVRLAGIAPAVWAATGGTRESGPISRDVLVDRLAQSVGLPDGYAPLLDAALAELVREGVLEVGQ